MSSGLPVKSKPGRKHGTDIMLYRHETEELLVSNVLLGLNWTEPGHH